MALPSRNHARAAVRSLPLIAVVVLVIIFAAGWAVAKVTAPVPRKLAQVDAPPDSIKHAGDSWLWLEGADARPRRLLRCGPGNAESVAEAVTTFDAAGDQIAWAARTNSGWAIYAAKGGQSARLLWQGKNEPKALKATSDAVFWLERKPGVDPDSALPPLTDALSLWTASASEGSPHRVADIMESEAGQILTVRPSSVVLTAYRSGNPGATAYYDVLLETGEARRMFGSEGRNLAVQMRDGSLYWSGPSAESSEDGIDMGVFRRSPSGRTESLLDWMSPLSRIAADGSRVYLIEGNMDGTIWQALPRNGLPEPMPLPVGYSGAAVADGKALLFRREPPGKYTFYELDL